MVESEPFQVVVANVVFTFYILFSRMYNQAFTYHEEKHVLDAGSNNLRMSQLDVNKITQKFFKVETSYESSACPAPDNTDLDAQSIIGRSGPCNRRHALVNGRCQKVYGRKRSTAKKE